MGIWEELRSVAAKFINRKAPPNHDYAVRKSVDSLRLDGAQKLDDHVTDASRRENISRILTNIGKFAVDSAVDETIKGVTGGIQICKIAKEGVKDQASSHSSDGSKKQGLLVVMEEMLANMEKMQDMNSEKPQNKVLTLCDKELEPLKEFSDEPIKSSAPPEAGKRRIFIRSRL